MKHNIVIIHDYYYYSTYKALFKEFQLFKAHKKRTSILEKQHHEMDSHYKVHGLSGHLREVVTQGEKETGLAFRLTYPSYHQNILHLVYAATVR